MSRMRTSLSRVVVACVLAASVGRVAHAETGAPEASAYKPTIEDWVGVNAAVDNYTLGLELQDHTRSDKAFWPDAHIVMQPEPGKSITVPYQQAEGPPPKPPGGGPPMANMIGTNIPPWHLALNHHFEFQSPTRATHYGYFISVYPDLKTKITTVGLPGHYEDILEKRDGEWRILQRTTTIGVK